MTFNEAKYHARHNMKTHKNVVVTGDGSIYMSNEPILVVGHVVKLDGEEVKEEPKVIVTETEQKSKK